MAEDPYLKRLHGAILNQLRKLAVLRSRSYKRLFSPGGVFSRDAEIVLADLRDQGFANKTTFHADPYEHGRRAGRREIWLRIMQHLNLDEERVQQLVELEDDN